MRKDNEKLFNTGRLRKKAIWSRIAQEFKVVISLQNVIFQKKTQNIFF